MSTAIPKLDGQGASSPLAEILPYLSSAASAILASALFVGRALGAVTSKLLYPIAVLSPVALILYIFAPFIVFVQTAFYLAIYR